MVEIQIDGKKWYGILLEDGPNERKVKLDAPWGTKILSIRRESGN